MQEYLTKLKKKKTKEEEERKRKKGRLGEEG
jgi:hypothetical protein